MRAQATAVDPERQAPTPVRGAPGTAAERLLALQRTAGNRAVGRALARWSAPPVPDAEDVAREAAKEASEAAIETFRSMGAGTEEEVKQRALDHAWRVSWAMTGKSRGEAAARGAHGAWAWATGDETYEPARVQSVLGGAYLRMYLAGQVDTATVSAAGAEMIASPEFAKLRSQLHAHLAKLKPSADRATAEEQIRKSAQAYLDYRMKNGGLAFRYELNAVIGGVGDADVDKVEALVHTTDAGPQVWYALHLRFEDKYDFDNARSGVYDAYRKKLAKLVADGKYPDFWEAYGREVIGVGAKTGLDSAAIFASFMYAIEQAGWTPGPLPWQVTIPMTGTLP